MLPKGFLHSQLSTGRGIPVSGMVARLGHPGTAVGWHLQLSHILEKWFSKCRKRCQAPQINQERVPCVMLSFVAVFPSSSVFPRGTEAFQHKYGKEEGEQHVLVPAPLQVPGM